jgi:hypothetical protein
MILVANDGFEPIVTDTACWSNGCFGDGDVLKTVSIDVGT